MQYRSKILFELNLKSEIDSEVPINLIVTFNEIVLLDPLKLKSNYPVTKQKKNCVAFVVFNASLWVRNIFQFQNIQLTL